MILSPYIYRRSPSRIISLANDIRSELDSQKQKVLEGKPDGVVRLFIQNSSIDKPVFENEVRAQMMEITNDELWSDITKVKHLTLEHKMAAVRLGFSDMYEALSLSKKFHTGLRSGDLPFVRFFFRKNFSVISTTNPREKSCSYDLVAPFKKSIA